MLLNKPIRFTLPGSSRQNSIHLLHKFVCEYSISLKVDYFLGFYAWRWWVIACQTQDCVVSNTLTHVWPVLVYKDIWLVMHCLNLTILCFSWFLTTCFLHYQLVYFAKDYLNDFLSFYLYLPTTFPTANCH